MPRLDDHLHYRMIDVSTIKELSRRWYPRAYYNAPAKGGGHRALADILESINELRYYRATVLVPPPGPDTDASRAAAAELTGGATAAHADSAATPSKAPLDCIDAARRTSGRDGGCSSAGRAPGCGPGCRGFKSRHSPHLGLRAVAVVLWPG